MISPHRRALGGAMLDVALLAVIGTAIGVYGRAFTGFPKGYDAWGHLSKARILDTGFPAVTWNDQWYAGQPAVLGSNPPGYHLLLVAASRVTGQSLPQTMILLAALAVVAAVAGCYLLVLATTGSRGAALPAGGLLLASPALWDQLVELGQYPRFTATAIGSLAAGCAALQRRRHTRVRATLTVAALAASLGTHPVSGGIACGVVGLLLLCAATPPLAVRAGRAVSTVLAAVTVCSGLYLPRALSPPVRSGPADVQAPLRWGELGWPTRDLLNTLPPAMLPGLVVMAGAVLWAGVELSWRARRITDRLYGAPAARSGLLMSGAMLAVRMDAVAAQRERRARGLPEVLVALGLAAAALAVVGYGVAGHLVHRLPYDLPDGLSDGLSNGLLNGIGGQRPRDLLVSVAWLLSAAIGIGGHIAIRHRHRITRAVTAGAAAVTVAGCLVVLVLALPGGVRDGSGAPTDAMIALLPQQAHGNDEYRIGGTSDLTSRWINAVTDTRQLRGYDDRGNLHLDWHFWLEQTITAAGSGTTPQQRRFLLDYFAVRWLLTDSARASANLAADPRFRALGRDSGQAGVSAWEYRDAHPVTTAVTAPTVLVVGDDAHYDLLLRALALADVGVDRILPVHGPATLTEVTAEMLRAHPAVVVYGATPGDHPATAAFAGYVRDGGHVLVDVGDSRASAAVARAVGAPVTGTHVRSVRDRWQFTGTDADLTSRWSPPVYEGDADWDVRAPDDPVGAAVLLATHGTPVLVRSSVGDGTVTWSGMNLAYHALSFADAGEAAYLSRLLGAAGTARPVTPVPAERRGPQHRVVTLPAGVNQVLLREHVTGAWHASADGRPVPLLAAGPDMMFVQVPDHAGPVTVRLEHRPGPAERFGALVSVLAVLAVLGYAAGGRSAIRAGGAVVGSVVFKIWHGRLHDRDR